MKYQLFFLIRMEFAFISSYCETALYQTIIDYVNPYIAQFFLFGIIYSAGMTISSVGIYITVFLIIIYLIYIYI